MREGEKKGVGRKRESIKEVVNDVVSMPVEYDGKMGGNIYMAPERGLSC